MSFVGTQELIIILVVALIVVGPKRLPDLAKNLGKGIRNFKNATAKMRSELDESGAMDEINELKAQMQGLRDEVNPMLRVPELTADATSAPKLENATESDAALDSLLNSQSQTSGEREKSADSDDPLVRILGGGK